MSHTPGPWKVDSSMISTGWVLVTKSNGDVVANVNAETGPDIPPLVSIKMPALADANLITAAPEMLAVLEELRESASYWSEYDVPLGIVERIEYAIRKARGGESPMTRETKAVGLLHRVLDYFLGGIAFPEKMERLLGEIEAFLTEIEAEARDALRK